jgi:hypothetical protein
MASWDSVEGRPLIERVSIDASSGNATLISGAASGETIVVVELEMQWKPVGSGGIGYITETDGSSTETERFRKEFTANFSNNIVEHVAKWEGTPEAPVYVLDSASRLNVRADYSGQVRALAAFYRDV